MANDKLHLSITELRTEIARLELGDSSARERIEQLIHQLEQQANDPDDLAPGREAHQELPGLIERFEAEHPDLTQVLNRIMVSLSNMGI